MVSTVRINNIRTLSSLRIPAETTAQSVETPNAANQGSETDTKKSSAAITANAKALISVQNKIPVELAEIEKDFFDDSKFHSLPIDKKIAVLKRLAAMEKNDRNTAEWLYHVTDDTEYIDELLSDKDRLSKLIKHQNNIFNNDFSRQNCDKKLKNEIALKIAMMRDCNRQSWNNLESSKGYKAIKDGELRLTLIEDIQKDTVIDENYFYNTLDRYETFTKNVLSMMNVSDEFKEKFLKIADIDMSQVNKLFKAVNKLNKKLADELFDMIINEKEQTERMAKATYVAPSEYLNFFDETIKLLEAAKANQDTATLLLQLPGGSHKSIIKILDRLQREKNNPQIGRLTTNILENFVEASKNNNNFSIPALDEIVSKMDEFYTSEYSEKGIDIIRILIAILNNYCTNNQQNLDLKSFLSYINKDNIALCNYLIKADSRHNFILDDKAQLLRYSSKLEDYGAKFFESEDGAREFYKLRNEVIKDNDIKTIKSARAVLNVRIKAPELYEKIKKNGVIKLIAEKKLSYNVLDYLNTNSDFSTDFYKDVKKVIKNESVVPEFSPTASKKMVFASTKTGDVVSIGENMFINDGEGLVKWNMTKEKYLDLFPPVLRFASKQGKLGDCYLISVIDNIMSKPEFRVKLYQMFSQDGDDIVVHLKGMDNYKYKNIIRFKNGDVEQFSHKRQLNGAKGLQMLELAYAECALRERSYDNIPHEAPMSVKINRLKSGKERQALFDLLGLDASSEANLKFSEIDKMRGKAARVCVKKTTDFTEETLREAGKYANYKNALVFVSIGSANNQRPEKIINKEYNLAANHAYSIKRYDEAKDILYITNPWNCAAEIRVPVSELALYANYVTLGLV